MNKENFLTPSVVSARQGCPGNHLRSRMKIQELGFNPFKLSSVTVSAPISAQKFCPFTGAVDQIWVGVDFWAAQGSSCVCPTRHHHLRGIAFLPNTQTQLGYRSGWLWGFDFSVLLKGGSCFLPLVLCLQPRGCWGSFATSNRSQHWSSRWRNQLELANSKSLLIRRFAFMTAWSG